MNRISIAALLAFFTLMISCSKDQGTGSEQASKNGQVTIHMLSKTVYTPGMCQVDQSKSDVDHAPIVRNEDILGYSESEHQFYLTLTSFKKIENYAGNTGFVVAVNSKAVYYGILKHMTSSSSCDQSITMSPLKVNNENILFVNLGYPGQLPGSSITDDRNKTELIEALRAQGKLR
ncbi:hypothetical protein [Pollutibacter soli]|uniref:hypothetical protein n=1 Tax=Pollutibacter soli TaxID=3034157 RepID=UPI0030141673